MNHLLRFVIVAALVVPPLVGCQTTRNAYYNAWEKMGYAKRERLVDNVKAAKDEQVQAKQQFATALDEFKSVVNFQGGDLEALYNKLDKELKRCKSQAAAVNSKIDSVKHVGTSLFDEWTGEIGQMKDQSLKGKSQQLYDQTHASYDEMLKRMDTAAVSMNPVLEKFNDRVLFIKANLNAQAIASLKGTEIELGGDIDKLVKDMNASIAEADKFISGIQSGS
jgi:hypothetical protein